MKILVIHNYYQQPGGERTAVERQLDLLQSKGQEVHLYSRDNAEINTFSLTDRIASLTEFIYSKKTYHQVAEICRSFKPDVAHVHNVFPLITPSIYYVLSDFNVPIVQTIHNYRFMCPNGLFYTNDGICERCSMGNTYHAIIHKCFRKSYVLSALYALIIGVNRRKKTFQKIDHFIVVNEFAQRKLIEFNLATDEKISVIGNFLPESGFNRKKSLTTDPYLVFMGRLSKEKGLYILLTSMIGLPKVKLKILGSGPEFEKVQQFITTNKLSTVDLLGFVEGDQKQEFLAGAFATVVPSLCYENTTYALLESMAVGTPVIGPNSGCFPFIIRHQENGLLFDYGNVGDLQRKIIWMLENQPKAIEMGKAAQTMIEAKFSAQYHYDSLTLVYQKVTR